MRRQGFVIGLSCFLVGLASAWVWAQATRSQVHRAGKLDFAFAGHGTTKPSPKALARLRRDAQAGAFRAPTEKEKLGLVSQAGRVVAGLTTTAVLTPQQPVVPGKASMMALNVINWWTPTPGHEEYPGYMQMGGDYNDLAVQVRVPSTKTILLTLNIKADKGDQFFLTVMDGEGKWVSGRMITADAGVQTLSCAYTPTEPGAFLFGFTPQDNFEWYFYSAEFSIEK